MKRNITVNIFGSLYPMDEDAYSMLNAYITNMRDYFSRQPDGKEIADDIEGRVAELMSELRQNGTEAISIEHIEDIINRVGKPEQFIEETEMDTTENEIPPIPTSTPKKKLFRDPEHKLIGGVFGGLGCYLGVSPLWLRLAYILILFSSLMNLPETLPVFLLLVSAYFVCWGSIPLAANPAERLQMKGEPVNLTNMCDEFLTSTREMLSRQSELNKEGRLGEGIVSVFKWVLQALGILLIIVIGGIVIANLVALVCAVAAPWNHLRETLGNNMPLTMIFDSNPNWLIWMTTISISVFLMLSLYLLAHFTMRLLGSVHRMSTTLRAVCLVIWFIALGFTAASITKTISNTTIQYHRKHKSERKQSNDESKAEIKQKQLHELNIAGWELGKQDQNVKTLTNSGQHYSGNKNIIYLEASVDEPGLGMEYEVVRSQTLAPGIYRLEAKGRSNGNGAEIFAYDGKNQRYSSPIPVCGSKGGSVWNDARIKLKADSTELLPDRNHLENLAHANHSQGYGWSEIVVENITVGPDSILRYGVTNVSPTQTWDGTWLSATAFEVKRQEQKE